MVGTTEVTQNLDDPIECSIAEQDYLLEVYNTYFTDRKTVEDIIGTFAGLRPLVKSNRSATRTSREYVIERNGRLVTVFGGKWTTSRVLGERVAEEIKIRITRG